MQEAATEGAVEEGVVVAVGVIMVPTGTTATVTSFGISTLFFEKDLGEKRDSPKGH